MAETTFDPYRKWLGIPADQRPPTHYRLLGISPSEQDPQVIRETSLMITAHIRKYQAGPHGEEAIHILREIAEANRILLDPQRRKEYDQQLGLADTPPIGPSDATDATVRVEQLPADSAPTTVSDFAPAQVLAVQLEWRLLAALAGASLIFTILAPAFVNWPGALLALLMGPIFFNSRWRAYKRSNPLLVGGGFILAIPALHSFGRGTGAAEIAGTLCGAGALLAAALTALRTSSVLRMSVAATVDRTALLLTGGVLGAPVLFLLLSHWVPFLETTIAFVTVAAIVGKLLDELPNGVPSRQKALRLGASASVIFLAIQSCEYFLRSDSYTAAFVQAKLGSIAVVGGSLVFAILLLGPCVLGRPPGRVGMKCYAFIVAAVLPVLGISLVSGWQEQLISMLPTLVRSGILVVLSLVVARMLGNADVGIIDYKKLTMLWGCGALVCFFLRLPEPDGSGAVVLKASLERHEYVERKLVPKPGAKETVALRLPPSADTDPSSATPGIITNSIGMKLALIPAGEFLMGSPALEKGRGGNGTQHRVRITKPFYVGQTEVTQGQWEAVMGTRPWRGKTYVKEEEGSDYPVPYVSWEDADEFCRRLSQKESGVPYRLPTESEWEYACRAGSGGRFTFGESEAELLQHGWFCENAWDVGEKYAHRVGQKQSNAFGLFDMHGNVWEWCADWHGTYPSTTVSDPTGPSEGSFRVSRGGSWSNDAAYCRSALRGRESPGCRSRDLGFRVARSASGEQAR